MSALDPRPAPQQDPTVTAVVRVGTVVAVALALSIVVNVFAGSLAFAALLTLLAIHAGWSAGAAKRETQPRRSLRDRVRPAHAAERQASATVPSDATPPLPPSTPAAGASAPS
jgi:hypothetical protein